MEIREMVPLLSVEDPERSIGFYTRVLSFQVTQDVRAGGRTIRAMLQNGAVKLMISVPDDPGSAGRRQHPSRHVTVLYLFVESARSCRTALRAQGIETGEMEIGPYGIEEFRLRDPDGHEIAIGSPLMQVA